MRIYCRKCGDLVDTLAKRRHRCKKDTSEEVVVPGIQLIWWTYLAQQKFDHVGNGKTD